MRNPHSALGGTEAGVRPCQTQRARGPRASLVWLLTEVASLGAGDSSEGSTHSQPQDDREMRRGKWWQEAAADTLASFAVQPTRSLPRAALGRQPIRAANGLPGACCLDHRPRTPRAGLHLPSLPGPPSLGLAGSPDLAGTSCFALLLAPRFLAAFEVPGWGVVTARV